MKVWFLRLTFFSYSTISFFHKIVVKVVFFPNQNKSSIDPMFNTPKNAGTYLSSKFTNDFAYVLYPIGSTTNSNAINKQYQRPA